MTGINPGSSRRILFADFAVRPTLIMREIVSTVQNYGDQCTLMRPRCDDGGTHTQAAIHQSWRGVNGDRVMPRPSLLSLQVLSID
jgi:hypothetical protein